MKNRENRYHYNCALIVLVTAALWGSSAAAAGDRVSTTFTGDQLEIRLRIPPIHVAVCERDGWSLVTSPELDGPPAGIAHSPDLPGLRRWVSIPADSQLLSLRLEGAARSMMLPAPPRPAPAAQSMEEAVESNSTEGLLFYDTVGADDLFPRRSIQYQRGKMGSTHVLVIDAYPVRYMGSTGRLMIMQTPEIVLRLRAPGAHPDPAPRNSVDRELSEMLANRREAFFGAGLNGNFLTMGTSDDEPVLDLAIITTGDWLTGVFDEYRAARAQRGLTSELFTVEWIETRYPGSDRAEKIRNCIIDLYTNRGLSYVLLGGDDERIPVVVVETSSSPCDPNGTESDRYYFGLDGDGTSDIMVEVLGGRLSVDTAVEARSAAGRWARFDSTTWNSEDVAMLAQSSGLLGSDMMKDEIWATNLAGIDCFINHKVYDDACSVDYIKREISAGRGMINYFGYGFYNLWAETDFNDTAARSVTNGDKLPFIVSATCQNASFAYDDCLGEAFMEASQGGIIGFFGSSIMEWLDHARTAEYVIWQNIKHQYLYDGTISPAMAAYSVTLSMSWNYLGDPTALLDYRQPDTEPPVIVTVDTVPTSLASYETVAIGAVIQDDQNVRYSPYALIGTPDGGIVYVPLARDGWTDNYGALFTDTSQFGWYTVMVVAEDLSGNRATAEAPGFEVAAENLTLGVRFDMPEFVQIGDVFWVNALLDNPGTLLEDQPVFFVLEVQGAYWFWPSWVYHAPPDATAFDYEVMDIPHGTTMVEVVPAFSWPRCGTMTDGLYFYGAMVNHPLDDLVGEMAVQAWAYGS
ncbi:hypothetical protein JW905_12875 [bacterium]|nr:hypothetical protein [candidate division CSSED10-310 bacterium]